MMDKYDTMTEQQVEALLLETNIGSRHNLKESVELVRTWVNKQAHLPDLTDDVLTTNWISNIVIARKNRLEQVKNILDLYYSAKAAVPELYSNRDPTHPGIRANSTEVELIPLPRLTPDNYGIVVFRRRNTDVSAHDPTQTMRRCLMLADMVLHQDIHCGQVIIFDLGQSNIFLWLKYNLVLLSKLIGLVTKVYPARIQGIHIINASTFINQVLRVVKPFLNDKILNRIKIYSKDNYSELYDIVPRSCLPKEFGGTLNSSLEELNAFNQQRLEEMKVWFAQDEKQKTDETKRLSKNNLNEIFGVEGTIRSLAVD